MSEYYCGRCDLYYPSGGSFPGTSDDLCPACLRPLEMVEATDD